MQAVIKTGGKQYRVAEGDRVEIERINTGADGADAADGTEVSFTPILVIDGADVRATPAQLDGAEVRARIVGASRGPKIDGFVYQAKARRRRRWGHRQHYTTVEIMSISRG